MTSRAVTASAPGKAVLIGEYAVLHGTSALVMAVDRRVQVRIEGCPPEQSRLLVPQLQSDAIGFSIGADGALSWPDTQAQRPELALSRNVIEGEILSCMARGLPEPGGMVVQIDSAELHINQGNAAVKLGLGSSAAVSLALSAALRAYLGDGHGQLDVAAMLQRHRAQQGGRGSGVDLAAALQGGVLAYRLNGDQPQTQALPWPEDWPVQFVWTGQAASTGSFLRRYETWRCEHASDWADLHARMDDCARAARSALEGQDVPQFLAQINEYRELMGKMGVCIGAPVLSAPHLHLAKLAKSQGAAYKPCGAGGGDLGLFVAPDAGTMARIEASLGETGFQILPLKPSVSGLQVTISEAISPSEDEEQ